MFYSLTLFPFFKGFAVASGLIVSIGAQNAFILKQGLKKEGVLLIVSLCFILDALLILLGVAGLGGIIAESKTLSLIATWGGFSFLFLYGLSSFRMAFKSRTMSISEDEQKSSVIKLTLLTLALTLLNPHVYLDTVVLLGSISQQFNDAARYLFAGGAITMSFIWFYSIGFGARWLRPLFSSPKTWRILDTIIGVMMWSIALSLIL